MGYVEHLVLTRVKPEAAGSKEEQEWVKMLDSLRSLEGILHLKVARVVSTKGPFLFTYALHIRFTSRAVLESYAVHPEHLKVVDLGNKVMEFLMAIDWELDQQEAGYENELNHLQKLFILTKLKAGVDPKSLLQVAAVCKGKFGNRILSAGPDFSYRSREHIDFGYLVAHPENDESVISFLQEELNELVDNFVVVRC